MANQEPSYFVCPRFIWGPDGPLRLGNIVAQPQKPHIALNGVPFAPPLPKAEENEKEKWKDERGKHRYWATGIWLEVLQFLGFGAEVGVEAGKSKSIKYHFDKLVTRYFVPDDEYLAERMKDEKVDKFIRDNKFKKRVYMITGVMIACRPAAATGRSNERGVYAKIGGSLAAAGAPGVSVGPEVEVTWGQDSKTSFQGGSDFVFAYELREIYYKVVEKRRVLRSKEFTDGAVHGFSGEARKALGVDSSGTEEVIQVLVPIGIDESPLKGRNIGVAPKEIMDNNGEVLCEYVVLEDEALE